MGQFSVGANTGYLANESGLASGGIVYRKFTPEYFIIPVHHKVRFPYEGIALFAQQVEEAYKTKAPLRYAPGSAPPQVSWSVALRDVRDFKSKLRRCSTMDPEAIIDLLYLSLPKNIWVLSFWTEASERAKSPILDFHFDATALRQSGGLIGMTPYDKLPEAETFMSIVSAHLQAYDESQLAEMDSELQPIMRAARNFILESLRAEREAMAAAGAAASL